MGFWKKYEVWLKPTLHCYLMFGTHSTVFSLQLMIRGPALNQGSLRSNTITIFISTMYPDDIHRVHPDEMIFTVCSDETDTPRFDPDSSQSNCALKPAVVAGKPSLHHTSADYHTTTLQNCGRKTQLKPHKC